MSNVNIASLRYITPLSLSQKLVNSPLAADNSKIAVIDVRDSDHIGGHIRGSQHVPSTQLRAQLPTLARTLKDKDVVVFHCALSQQRGPNAALEYMRQREAVKSKEVEQKDQEVLVLEGGFSRWQES